MSNSVGPNTRRIQSGIPYSCIYIYKQTQAPPLPPSSSGSTQHVVHDYESGASSVFCFLYIRIILPSYSACLYTLSAFRSPSYNNSILWPHQPAAPRCLIFGFYPRLRARALESPVFSIPSALVSNIFDVHTPRRSSSIRVCFDRFSQILQIRYNITLYSLLFYYYLSIYIYTYILCVGWCSSLSLIEL